jgi:plastocyanin
VRVDIARLRRLLLLVLAGVLGAAAAVLPAVAASEGATVRAENVGLYYHYWRPAEVSVSPGGAVTFTNPYMETKHGIEWKSPPETPSCTSGIPVGTSEAAAGTNWSGSCTFAKPGVYTYWCTVHGSAMSGTITVGSAGTTTTTTTPPTTTTTTQTQPGTPTVPIAGGPGGGGSPTGAGSPFASTTVRLAAGAHGRLVSGSVDVSPAGSGGRLEVDLLAARAALASARAHTYARVGRLVRPAVPAGVVRFKVSLDGRALHALRAHHHLALTVRILLTPAGGAPTLLPSHHLLLRG